MGAENQSYIVKAKNRSEVDSQYANLKRQAQYDHGHSGYSGTIAESPGLTIITDYEANDIDSAEDYIYDNANKWENSLAVRIKDSDTWIIGGCYSS